MASKIHPAFMLTVVLSLFNGCWWDSSSTADAPTVSGLAISPNQVATSDIASQITGSIGISTDNATVSFKVTNTTGDVTGKFDISGIPGSIGGTTALAGSILATSASEGSYTLTITVTDAEGQVVSQSAGFTVGRESTPQDLVSQGSVTLGAQSSSHGSFLQLTGDVAAWTSGDGKPVGSIYVVFGQDGASVLSLMSPKAADGDGFTLGWATLNSAKIADLGANMPVNKAAVVSAMASTTTEKVAATPGKFYGVKYGSTDTYSVIYVTSIDPATRSANAVVTVYQ